MDSPPPNSDALSRVEYWNTRYISEKDDLSEYEWFRTFDNLQPFFESNLPPASDEVRLIHLGCGLSSLTSGFYSLGYINQVNIDFSQPAIEIMKERHRNIPTLKWLVMDVRQMQLGTAEFDIAIDKGTLDAMLYGSLWSPEPEIQNNVRSYVDEVARILRPGGKWLYITYRQPHFLRPLLARPDVWSLEVHTLQDGPGTFEYFAWVMVKNPT